MAIEWTKDALEALTHKQLYTLYENALASSDPKASEVLTTIETHKMMERLGGGYRRSHRLIVDMETICRSSEGNAAAIRAAENGEAPMAGVDPLLAAALGAEYGQRDSTTWAGAFVAEEIEASGWRRAGRKKLPDNCIARTAAFFLPPIGDDAP
ncbi:hypothetical protein [Sphingomonas sp.]|jgi:hypothetical protein|uniref:hypothetical protein n=1 Tax=Sphingomonas sp. TaxID=28214 RepID=UPI002E164D7D|nr:hypothetical protein [Sphingomonas sp.]